LRTITIPPLVKTISGGLFRDCYSLTSISLPSSLTSIVSGEVFSMCYNLTSISVNQTIPLVFTSSMVFYDVNKNTCILYVPVGSLEAYKRADQWRDFVNIREIVKTGVSVQTMNAVSIYPNPVTEGFHINGLTEPGLLTLTNLNGSILFTKKVTDNEYITISTFSKGLYILKLTTANGTIEKKIIKE